MVEMKSFTVSVEAAVDWLRKLAATGQAPGWVTTTLAAMTTLRTKKIEITIRSVDE